MKLNKLLERQVKKLLPQEFADNPQLRQFLHAINDSYTAYERDNELTDRAFKLSEEEYILINKELKSENELKKISISKLKETISELGDTDVNNTSDDLLDVVKYLEKQVSKRKQAEMEFSTAANRLTSLIINMQEGILVEDDSRHIALTNLFSATCLISLPVRSH